MRMAQRADRNWRVGFLLPSLFFGCLILRLRRKYAKRFIAALLLSLAGCALWMIGCTSFTQASATPGTYVIQVNGTGVNSDLSHYSNVTLNITK
jgi:hypothetical protein